MASNGSGPSLPPFETFMEIASNGEMDREGRQMEKPERGRGIHLMHPNRYAGPFMSRAPYINANGEETEELQPNQEVGVNRSAPVPCPTIPGFEAVNAVAAQGMRDYIPNEVRGAARYGRIPGIGSLYDAVDHGMRDRELEEERRRQEQGLFEREAAERLAEEQWRRDERQRVHQETEAQRYEGWRFEEQRIQQEQRARQEQLGRQRLEEQQHSTPDVEFTNDATYDKAWEQRYYDYPEDWPEARSKKDIRRKNETAVPVAHYWENQGPLLLQSIDTDAVLARQQKNTQGLYFPVQSESVIRQSQHSMVPVPQQHIQGIVFPSQSQGVFQPIDHNTALAQQWANNQRVLPARSQEDFQAANYMAFLKQEQTNKQGRYFPAQSQLPFQNNNRIMDHAPQWANNRGLPFRTQGAFQADNRTVLLAQQQANMRLPYPAQAQLPFHHNNQIADPVRPWENNHGVPFPAQLQVATNYIAFLAQKRGNNQGHHLPLYPQGGFQPTDSIMAAAQQWKNNQRYGFPPQSQSPIQYNNTATLQTIGHPILSPIKREDFWGQEYQSQNLDNSMYSYGADDEGWSYSEGVGSAYPIRNKSSSMCPVISRKKGFDAFQRPRFEGCDEGPCWD